jgi:hypothetical protein
MGVGRSLGSVGRLRLFQDVADVSSDGVETDSQLIGDLLIPFPSRNQTEDVDLAGG